MKNNVKKLFALALVVAMTMGLAVTAFAANQTVTVTIEGVGKDVVTAISYAPAAGGRGGSFTKQSDGTFTASIAEGNYVMTVTKDETKGKFKDVRDTAGGSGNEIEANDNGAYPFTVAASAVNIYIQTEALPFSPEANGAGDVEYDVTNSVPVINVAVTAADAVVINPYRLNYSSAKISGNKTIITNVGKIQSTTLCPLKVEATVIGTATAGTGTAAVFDTSSVMNESSAKKVFLYLEMAEATGADENNLEYTLGEEAYAAANTFQAVVKADPGTTQSNMCTIEAATGDTSGTPTPSWAVFQLFGDCSQASTGWTTADEINVNIALSFEAQVNAPSAGDITSTQEYFFKDSDTATAGDQATTATLKLGDGTTLPDNIQAAVTSLGLQASDVKYTWSIDSTSQSYLDFADGAATDEATASVVAVAAGDATVKLVVEVGDTYSFESEKTITVYADKNVSFTKVTTSGDGTNTGITAIKVNGGSNVTLSNATADPVSSNHTFAFDAAATFVITDSTSPTNITSVTAKTSTGDLITLEKDTSDTNGLTFKLDAKAFEPGDTITIDIVTATP